MSFESDIHGLIATAQNTQQPARIELRRGLIVACRVNSSTEQLEILTYREKPPRINNDFTVPSSSKLECEIVTRTAGGLWSEPVCLTWVRWQPWQSVKMSNVEIISAALGARARAVAANAARADDEKRRNIDILIQKLLKQNKPYPINVDIFSELWREGLEQLDPLEIKRRVSLPISEWYNKPRTAPKPDKKPKPEPKAEEQESMPLFIPTREPLTDFFDYFEVPESVKALTKM